jgi:hypothetical protein
MAVVLIPMSLQLSEARLLQLITRSTFPGSEVLERKPQDMMIKFGAAQGIEIIDLLPWFKERESKTGEPLYLEVDGHWNSNGHMTAADYVAQELAYRKLTPTETDGSAPTGERPLPQY